MKHAIVVLAMMVLLQATATGQSREEGERADRVGTVPGQGDLGASRAVATRAAASKAGFPWKGVTIGAIAGVTGGLLAASELCDGAHCYTSGYVTLAVSGAAIGASLGAVVQWLVRHKGRPSPRPMVQTPAARLMFGGGGRAFGLMHWP
jgi:hypothetical protein